MSTNPLYPTVIKKDGEPQDWNFSKVKRAVSLAGQRTNQYLKDHELELFENVLLDLIPTNPINVRDLHEYVCQALDCINRQEIATSYRQFRNYKIDFERMFEEIYQQTDKVLMHGDKENANFDSTLVSTKGSIIRGFLSKEIFKRFHLSREEQRAIHEGYIYIHDLRDLIFNSHNCCLFDIGTVMKGGFQMASVHYNEPSTFFTACQVVSKVILNATAQQFGGFTVPDIDKVLVPYLRKSREKHQKIADEFIPHRSARELYVRQQLDIELSKGFKAIECDINTVSTSRGDFAFTTFSFGNLDNPDEFDDQKLICEAILRTRMKGHGKGEPVPFPKLVFLFNPELYSENQKYKDLFELSIECSSKCMYPDYLSLDPAGDAGRHYLRSGQVVSPMG